MMLRLKGLMNFYIGLLAGICLAGPIALASAPKPQVTQTVSVAIPKSSLDRSMLEQVPPFRSHDRCLEFSVSSWVPQGFALDTRAAARPSFDATWVPRLYF